ncbi:hypothetical protein NBRC111894_3798 [Sporolactobacillus inulinus]|uniref:Uncharacterized protein n=1 Tax=Sporolactobacillus inulinus TaxID=2078 RepID=A0A4Y1ZH72_9BACL|nr:hypothetical protein NBRC111894_3798 [Sporolactobacillus inulinus]
MIQAGFSIKLVKEPMATEEMVRSIPEMKDENRRPMFLIISAEK